MGCCWGGPSPRNMPCHQHPPPAPTRSRPHPTHRAVVLPKLCIESTAAAPSNKTKQHKGEPPTVVYSCPNCTESTAGRRRMRPAAWRTRSWSKGSSPGGKGWGWGV